MQHPGNGQVGHFHAGIEVYHLGAGLAIALARAGRFRRAFRPFIKKSSSGSVRGVRRTLSKKPGLLMPSFILLGQCTAIVDGFGVFVVQESQISGILFQGHDKAVARGRVVHRRDARAGSVPSCVAAS